jgi:DNA-binding transcriptional LysR family regulator
MHISQPALSIEIRKLEDILGLKLFDRAGNRISLNENGKILNGNTSKIFDLVTQAEYKLLNRRDYITGTIQLGASNAPGTYIFPNVIAQYKGQYPGVNINLNIATRRIAPTSTTQTWISPSTAEVRHTIRISPLKSCIRIS